MTPAALLIIAVSITFAAAVAERIAVRHHRKRLQKLAGEWRMNYSPQDQFRLTPRVFANFPVAGAAKIRVVDLIYVIDHDLYHYIFTAEYTAGVVIGKRRIRRAGSFSEPRDRGGDSAATRITLAPTNLPLIDQYRKLRPAEEACAKIELIRLSERKPRCEFLFLLLPTSNQQLPTYRATNNRRRQSV